MELPDDVIMRDIEKLRQRVGLGKRGHVKAGMRIYFPLHEVEAQAQNRLVLELEGSAGHLKDTAPAEGKSPTIGAVN